MTQISQSSSNTGLGYDNANRRTSLTLPNNVTVTYGYDNDSRLSSITYKFGGNTLGNLTYGYDQLGRRTQAGGSFARTGLPGAVASATYDVANQLTNWNGVTISYDANGNMLSGGGNTFTWNARNQVATLNSVALQYDAFGRRIKNAAGTSFFYDGANAVQELSGTTVTANLISGGIDEVFTRADSAGSFAQLKDALGSTIALVDSTGNTQTTYTYDPYGGTSVTGTSNGNEFQYTGRENEGNGVYFYRARYYSSVLSRFISEDPLGFVGSGPNLYAYVFDSPTNFVDPLGLQSTQTSSGTITQPYAGNPSQAAVDQAVADAETQFAKPRAPLGLGRAIPVIGTVLALEGHTAGPCEDELYRPSWCAPRPNTLTQPKPAERSPMPKLRPLPLPGVSLAGRKTGRHDILYEDYDAECELFASEYDGLVTKCHYNCKGLGELCSTPASGKCDQTAYSANLGPCE